MATKAINDKTFKTDVLSSSLPVLVDYWAEWCGPCKMIGPSLEELAISMKDKLTIAKLNIDENPEVPTQYGIRSIPTLMLFKAGAPVATTVGAMSKSQLQAWLEKNL